MRFARYAAAMIALALIGTGTAAVAAGMTPATTPRARATAGPVAVWIGDSYTQGGNVPAGQRLVDLISAQMGWWPVNLGRGGTGYLGTVAGANARMACGRDYCPSFTEMIDEAAAQHPAVVVVSGGRNEAPVWTDPAWANGVIAFYVALRAALPDAQIYAMSPLWDDDPAPATDVFARAIVRVAVEDVGGTYVDLGQPLAGRPDLVIADGVHPNAVGHAAIAAAFTTSDAG